ncbi:MAG: MASE1 domain-containing protein [Cyanobacteria bacterium J06560_2]
MRALSASRAKLLYLCGNVALAGAYYGAAELSRWLASTPQNVTPVWPPDGIAVAAVFLYGFWMLPGVLLGSFLANIWAFWDPSSWLSLLTSINGVLAIAFGTTLGTALGVFLLKRTVPPRYPLARVLHVVYLLLFAGLLGPVVNALVGVAVLCSLEIVPWSAYGDVWLTWWISNVAGIFIVTPAIISWESGLWNGKAAKVRLTTRMNRFRGPVRRARRRKLAVCSVEITLIVGLTFAVGAASFWQAYSLEYMLIPLLVWPTFRYGQQGGTLAAVGISAMAIMGTVRGLGSFAEESLDQSLTLLQSFIAVTVFTALVLAAVLKERRAAEEKLRVAITDLATANSELEQRVSERTQELDDKNKRLKTTLQELHQVQSQMVQNEKMSSLGQMVAGIAHEINNPVNFIHGNLQHMGEYTETMLALIEQYQVHYPEPVEALQEKIEESEIDFVQLDAPKVLASMGIGTQRIREIVLSLRNFSRLDESALKQANIHEGLESTLLIVKHRLSLPHGLLPERDSAAVEVVRDYGELPLVECYPGSLNQVFMNVLTNAIDALELHLPEMVAVPMITIRTEVVDEWVRIAIADNGPGIDESARDSVFDPFFTTKPIGKGTGMGMSISYQIVTQKHGGRLTFDSVLGEGTEFVIEIPRVQSER